MKIPEVIVHRDANGTTVNSPCKCFGSPTRTHSTTECPWLKFRTDFPEGKRVQLHPGTDQWMMGDRFGEIRKVDLKTFLVHVKMDVSKKTIKCKPKHILKRDPKTDNRLEP
jgi:ribosomal protein L21E